LFAANALVASSRARLGNALREIFDRFIIRIFSFLSQKVGNVLFGISPCVINGAFLHGIDHRVSFFQSDADRGEEVTKRHLMIPGTRSGISLPQGIPELHVQTKTDYYGCAHSKCLARSTAGRPRGGRVQIWAAKLFLL
jgi:hypothetical protein